jgi:hypothetical protein
MDHPIILFNVASFTIEVIQSIKHTESEKESTEITG